MCSRLCLVLGGVRSGKSEFAEKLALDLDKPTLYVATGGPSDIEMRQRITRHRESRPAHWRTLEEPLDLAERIGSGWSYDDTPGAVLIDSLDMWVANMVLAYQHDEKAQSEAAVLSALDRLLSEVCRLPAFFFAVSSEVGSSLVPTYHVGRRFQDLVGLVNQRVAAAADQVYLVVAGIPMQLKGCGRGEPSFF
jgi:adenosylcobinamide kinase/adenosylcobinamide-phosphate guanylyltransferase